MGLMIPQMIPLEPHQRLRREGQIGALARYERKLRTLLELLPPDDEEAINEAKSDILIIEGLTNELCREVERA